VTAFWHHRTTKGGTKHGANVTKILPIAYWLHRLMIRKTGE